MRKGLDGDAYPWSVQYVGTMQPEHKMRILILRPHYTENCLRNIIVLSVTGSGMKQIVEPVSENVDRNILWDLNTRTVVQGDRG